MNNDKVKYSEEFLNLALGSDAVLTGKPEHGHEPHCNLMWPATLNTKDDFCDCSKGEK